MLKPDDKRVWVAALRSGDYEQGRHILRHQTFEDTPVRYCCLGVLGKVTGILTERQLFYNEGYDTLSKLLEVKNKMALITMNDEKMMSFKEIADWVEKNL